MHKKNIIHYKRFIIFSSLLLIGFLFFNIWAFSRISLKGKYENSFFQKQATITPTVLAFVPHPDDEIWLCGLIAPELIKNNVDFHVIYSTEGVSTMQGERNKEAIRSCGHLGIKKENVHFMGFENIKQFDLSAPSGTRTIEIRNAYKDSIKSIIHQINPQLIICSDFDFNRDHRTLSLLFDESIGEMLKKKELDTSVILWKGYCYNTSYYSVDDFYKLNLKSTVKPIDVQNKLYETDSPQFLWSDRIRVPVSYDVLTRLTWLNPIYSATKEHVTQHVQLKTLLALNADEVFWQRRLDNILYDSNISASSGTTDYLCDFKIYDSNHITYDKRYNVEYTNCTWIPDKNDPAKEIVFNLERAQKISYLNIYDNPTIEDNINKLDIIINDSLIIPLTKIEKKGNATRIDIDNGILVKSIKIKIKDCEGEMAGINEVEAFPVSTSTIYPRIIKMCDINGDFIYKYFVEDLTKELPLSMYQYPDSREYTLKLNGKGVSLNGNVIKFDDNFESCVITATLKEDSTYSDRIEIRKVNKFDLWYCNQINQIDRLRLIISNSFEKNDVVQKIKRLFHFYL